MNILTITEYAKWKKVSRTAIYGAEERGEIEINRTYRQPIIKLNKKNTNWRPSKIHQKNARGKKINSLLGKEMVENYHSAKGRRWNKEQLSKLESV